MPTYIVECSVCRQPWEVTEPMFAAPGAWIIVPEHTMLNQTTSQPIQLVKCVGRQVSGVGLGERDTWGQEWPLRTRGRPLPAVLPGGGVKYLAD